MDCSTQTDDNYDDDLNEINTMDLWRIDKLIIKARKLIFKLMNRRKYIEEQFKHEESSSGGSSDANYKWWG